MIQQAKKIGKEHTWYILIAGRTRAAAAIAILLTFKALKEHADLDTHGRGSGRPEGSTTRGIVAWGVAWGVALAKLEAAGSNTTAGQ